jgi:hypothetical protein
MSLTISQNRPFSCVINKPRLRKEAKYLRTSLGVFFDTSGRVHFERINPQAKYNYLYKTRNYENQNMFRK